MYYKNNTLSTKTYHGVTLYPGEVAFVPGYINDVGFTECPPPAVTEKVSAESSKTSKEVSEQIKPKAKPGPKPKPKSVSKDDGDAESINIKQTSQEAKSDG